VKTDVVLSFVKGACFFARAKIHFRCWLFFSITEADGFQWLLLPPFRKNRR